MSEPSVIKQEKNEYSDALIDLDAAHEIMAHLMDYFIKLHRVVQQKVRHDPIAGLRPGNFTNQRS